MFKKQIISLYTLIVLLICTELFLRFYFGFCDNVLMREDEDYEYIAQANQKRFRFRNNIQYNSLSMRSEEIDTNANIILGLGDSVINGGVQTDQDSLATSILSDSLSKIYRTKTQFLNISAGSWGPDNCFSFLQKHGNFGTKAIFLFVSSHDAYDNMNFEKVVDAHESYQSKQYLLAIYELIDRYLTPRLKSYMASTQTTNTHAIVDKKQEKSPFNQGFYKLANYTKTKHIPFTIYLHAETVELEAGTYNQQGQEIIKFAKENNIPLLLDLENGLQADDFRDGIHINEQGQRKLAQTLINYLKHRKSTIDSSISNKITYLTEKDTFSQAMLSSRK